VLDIALAIIGNEILSGHVQDLNIRSLAKWLKARGHRLAHVEILPDELELLSNRLNQLRQQFPIVVSSGGLGPTADDVTKQVLGNMLKSQLAENQAATEMVLQHYARLKRPWSKQTNHYHMLPEGVTPLFNSRGLAPGLCHQFSYNTVLCFPGVPTEFNAMVEDHLSSAIKAHEKKHHMTSHALSSVCLRTWRIPEEKIFFELSPKLWSALEKFGPVSSLPRSTGVDIVITVPEKDLPTATKNILNLPEMAPLLEFLWHVGEESLPEVLLQKARAKKMTIACAESCTGGLVAHKLTDIAGSSDVLLGSAVCYSNELKIKMLNVKAQTIEQFGAVSTEVAGQMALGILQISGSSLAVATTGIAGPTGGTPEKPIGTLALAVASKKDGLLLSHILQFQGGRSALKERFSDAALMHLIAQLLKE
jgi:nicotinamide-nucleotide amidase